MGGFVGFTGGLGVAAKERAIKDMADRIRHRGPAGEKFYADEKIALGFRQLRGEGLVFNGDKSLLICCDGDIDAGLILRGYEEHGEKVAEKLRGVFAFVIYNLKTGEIYGARDCFGVKPFYYCRAGDNFMFGSEIKSFLAHPGFEKRINGQALKMYLVFQYSVLEETFFKGVFRLSQGCYFTCKNNELKITRYFHPEYKREHKSFEEYLRIISEHLESSVEASKTGVEEIGGFLSGGVDSSYIAALAKPGKTFTVGFAADGFDESMYARELADMLEIKNYKKIVSSDEFFDALPKVQYYSDEPHANLSSVPLYYLAGMAAEQVKVVLSGEGADEFFAGYLTFAESRLARLYKGLPLGLRKAIKNIARPGRDFRGKGMIKKYGQRVEDYYIGQAFIMDDSEADALLNEKYRSGMSYRDVTAPHFERVKGQSDLVKKSYLDLCLWLPNDIFLKADRMTAAHSLEARMPVLSREMFEIASRIPERYLLKGRVTKYIFREAAGRVLPAQWSKREKLGFPVPFRHWLREQKYFDMLKGMFEEEFAGEFFRRDRLLAMLDAHFRGEQNNGRKLYTVYAFLLWYKIYFIEGGGAP